MNFTLTTSCLLVLLFYIETICQFAFQADPLLSTDTLISVLSLRRVAADCVVVGWNVGYLQEYTDARPQTITYF